MSIVLHVYLELWFSADIWPVVGLQDHTATLFLVYWRTSELSSIVVVPVYIPTNSGGGVLLSHTLSSILSFTSCEVISYCSFDLHFSSNKQCWTSFHVTFRSSVCLLWINVYLVLPPPFWFGLFLNIYWTAWAVCVILEINLLLFTSFANIFSYFIGGGLFVLFMVSFAIPKAFKFN